MKYRDLWILCERCIETFDVLPETSCTTIDEHIEHVIQEYNNELHQKQLRQATMMHSTKEAGDGNWGNTGGVASAASLKSLHPDETIFVRETVNGVFHHRKMVDLAFQGYCSGMKRNRQDYHALIILTYLLIFRYNELGGETFRLLINRSAAYSKLGEYIEFLLSRKQLDAHVVPRWRTVYDDTYVEEVLVSSLLGPTREDVEEQVLNWCLVKGTNQTQRQQEREAALAEIHKKKPSRLRANSPKSPQLHKSSSAPRSRRGESIPPAEIREMAHLEPPPKLPKLPDRATTAEKAAVAAAKRGEKRSTLDPAIRERNRQAEASIPFRSFSATARPTNLPRLLEEQKRREEEEMAQRRLNRPGPEEVRKKLEAINDVVEVRTTAAALRREEIIYARRQEEADLALKRKAKELHDDSEFQAWKQAGMEQDERERNLLIAQRKVDMMLVDEAARATREKQQKHNQAVSRQLRKEAETVRKRNEKLEAKRIKQQQEKAKEIRALDENAAKAKEQLAKENAAIVAEQIRIKQENELKVAMALELERERKQEMIRHIKEVHAASVQMLREQREKKRHVKAVDLGELVAMTYDELQEKLVIVKKEHDDLVEQRRVAIIAQREQEKEERDIMAKRIVEERRRHREAKAAEREAKRAEAAVKAEKQKKLEEEKLLLLQEKLQQTREQRAQIQRERKEEDRQRRLAAQLLSADADAVEKAKWAEMYRGAQNTIVHAQNKRIEENRVTRKREETVHTLREKNIETAHEEKLATLKEKDATFSQRKDQFHKDTEYDTEVRMTAYRRMKEEQEKRKAMMEAW